MLTATEVMSITCINCPLGCILEVSLGADGQVERVTGNDCKLGEDYGRLEAVLPQRMVCAVLAVEGAIEPLSIKTSKPVEKSMILALLEEVKSLRLVAPIKAGELVAANVLNSGIDLIATKNIDLD